MALTHEEFIAYAVDKVPVPDPSLVPAIEEHRRDCADCADFEIAFARYLEAAPTLEVPPEAPGTFARILAAVHEDMERRGRDAAN